MATGYSVPDVHDDISMEVTLELGGHRRRWVIAPAIHGEDLWSYRVVTVQRVMVGALRARPDALAKRREFDEEIAIARAEGWK